jgi:hypothetical protein
MRNIVPHRTLRYTNNCSGNIAGRQALVDEVRQEREMLTAITCCSNLEGTIK